MEYKINGAGKNFWVGGWNLHVPHDQGPELKLNRKNHLQVQPVQ